MIGTSVSAQNIFSLNRGMLFSVAALMLLGWIMVGSASIGIAEKHFGAPLHYFLRQALFMGMGLVIFIVLVRIPISFWQRVAIPVFLVGILLLLALFIPGVGHKVNGSTRWIPLGIFNFQVAEVIKLCTIIYMADYLYRYQKVMSHNLTRTIAPLILLSIAAVLLLLQPDLGTVIVMFGTAMLMLFVGGARLGVFTGLVFVLIAGVGLLIWLEPYRLDRILVLLNPWDDPLNKGYQATQAQMAIGPGGLFGAGLGSSIQKLSYLPEAHTDFIFAILGEELGFFGGISVIGLYGLFVGKAFEIGRVAAEQMRTFAAQLAYGIGGWIGIQATINIGMNMGILPTKGLTLPLISYGGSSVLVTFAAIAILLRVDLESRQAKNRVRGRYT